MHGEIVRTIEMCIGWTNKGFDNTKMYGATVKINKVLVHVITITYR
jgi:hypothetical protein